MFGDVLIVDDEKDIRDLMAGILVDEGYSPVRRRTATPHCGRLPAGARRLCCSMSGFRAVGLMALRC